MAEDAIELFFSYSHKDEALRDALAAHLSNLEWQKIITSWHDRRIMAGTEWDDHIKLQLDQADIILLLISPDFIASRYCREVEIPQALQRHEAGTACVIPVIVRPFDWSDAPFAKLQAYPKDAKAVTLWANQDEAFVSVTQGIRTAAQNILTQRRQQRQQQETLRSQYQKKVEEILSDGKISIVERDTLDELRRELGLSADDAAQIEAHAFEPLKRYEANLSKYEQTLRRVIAHEYPIGAELQADLRLRQRDLGLKPEDVAQLEQRVFAEADAAHQAGQAIAAPPAPAPTPASEASAPPPPATAAPPHSADAVAPADLAADLETDPDYAALCDRLAEQDWATADRLTRTLLLRLANRTAEGWLDIGSIAVLPCPVLAAVDRLWADASQGRFGFSAQKRIFAAASRDEYAFSEQVGWRGKVGLFGGVFAWRLNSEVIYGLHAPSGHLPTVLFGQSTGASGILGVLSALMTQLDRCGVC